MDISGTWYNELGSTLVIDPVNGGKLTGSYVTAVSASGCAKGNYPLVGLTDVDTGGDAIAFVVNWKNAATNCKSVTAWCGQAQTINNEDTLTLPWLLTVESDPAQDWYATHVGQDVFTRNPPTMDVTKLSHKGLRRAHP